MGKPRLADIGLAALAAWVAFAVTEFALEGLVLLLFDVSENELMAQTVTVSRSGARYHAVTFAFFFVECLVIMWLYSLIRTRYRPGVRAALVTSVVVTFLAFVAYVNFTNMGAFAVEALALSLGFNLVEMPVAVLAGAGVYETHQLA